jgi:hypothetical protein
MGGTGPPPRNGSLNGGTRFGGPTGVGMGRRPMLSGPFASEDAAFRSKDPPPRTGAEGGALGGPAMPERSAFGSGGFFGGSAAVFGAGDAGRGTCGGGRGATVPPAPLTPGRGGEAATDSITKPVFGHTIAAASW